MSIELAPRAREGRPLYVLIPLLLLNLVLLSFQVQDPQGTLVIRKVVLSAGAPALNLCSLAATAVRNGWQGYIWLRGARTENEQLKEAVRRLTDQVRQMEALRQENERLRNILSLNQNISFRTIGARVVGRTPEFLSHVLYINRGSNAGVFLDAPVLSASGVIGRVVVLSAESSQVQLITNADASVGAMVDRTRSPGVVKGTGDSMLEMDYIGNTEPVEAGDKIVTSGLDGIFPKGLPVGRVVESRKGRSVFREIEITPSADLLHIEEVFVYLERPEKESPGEGSPSKAAPSISR